MLWKGDVTSSHFLPISFRKALELENHFLRDVLSPPLSPAFSTNKYTESPPDNSLSSKGERGKRTPLGSRSCSLTLTVYQGSPGEGGWLRQLLQDPFQVLGDFGEGSTGTRFHLMGRDRGSFTQ